MRQAWQTLSARVARGLVRRQDARGVVLFALGVWPQLAVLWWAQSAALLGWAGADAFHRPVLIGVHLALSALLAWQGLQVGRAWPLRTVAPPPGLVAKMLVPSLVGSALLTVTYGPTDTPMPMVFMAQLVLARALFSWAQMRLATVLALSCLAGGVLAVWAGLAVPLLAGPVYAGGAMNPWWTGWTRIVFAAAWLPYMAMMLFYAEVLQRRQRELETLGRTDALTGLLNRRAFMERLAREAHRQARSGRPLTLVMFDIDHFKCVNDRHGHPAGDEVLAAFARILKACTRDRVDAAGRWGGEEFVLLLPETDLMGAERVASKVCAALRHASFEADERAFRVTASAGVSQVELGLVDAALRAADRCLYDAKRSGRDRVRGGVSTEVPGGTNDRPDPA